MIRSVWRFICYWYFRYTMVTELYMVEPWEQVVVHCFFLMLFLILAYFNYSVLLGTVSFLLPVKNTTLQLSNPDMISAFSTH
ncbi:serine palmitoyltransferase small subunit A [Cloeon dipterum]|uniref:serine palmitoyltransferase small subunit A n=1 Tax=Cloeon dipterum TaxID=197152 RepID=UPI00321F7D58